jgi:hypothetical protein
MTCVAVAFNDGFFWPILENLRTWQLATWQHYTTASTNIGVLKLWRPSEVIIGLVYQSEILELVSALNGINLLKKGVMDFSQDFFKIFPRFSKVFPKFFSRFPKKKLSFGQTVFG